MQVLVTQALHSVKLLQQYKLLVKQALAEVHTPHLQAWVSMQAQELSLQVQVQQELIQ